jgi:G protein-coupled receptor 158
MRRDNPHISKRRGGRKPTHRRFSLQAFHYKHRLTQQGDLSADLDPVSRTPEESTNSVDMAIPTVTEEPSAIYSAADVTPRTHSMSRHDRR